MKKIIKIMGIFWAVTGSIALTGMEYDQQTVQEFDNRVKRLDELCMETVLKHDNLMQRACTKGSGQLPVELCQALVKKQLLDIGPLLEKKPLMEFPCEAWVTSVCSLKIDSTHRIISGFYDGKIAVWDFSGKQLALWQAHTAKISSIHAIESQEGIRIVSASHDGAIHLWSLEGNKIASCQGNGLQVSALYTVDTPQGIRIVSGSWDGTICTWDLHGNQKAIYQNENPISAVCAIQKNDDLMCVAGDVKGKIHIVNQNNLISSFTFCAKEITAICPLSINNENRITIGYCDGMIHIINLNGELLAQHQLCNNEISSLCTVTSNDNSFLIIGHKNNILYVFDVINKKTVLKAGENFKNGFLSTCTVQGENQYAVISGSWNKKICIWDQSSLLTRLNNTTHKKILSLYKVLSNQNNTLSAKYNFIHKILEPDFISTLASFANKLRKTYLA